MRNTLAIIVFLCPVFAFAQPQQQLFVPASPLTAQELAEQRERLKEDLDLTDAELDDLMGDGSTTFTYRDRDIVAAFPELRGDRRLSACANSMAGGATELVFLSDSSENEVTVKSARCSPAESGLMCKALEVSRYYFFESPDQFFSLDNVTFDEARTILTTYKERGIAELPEWFAGFSYREVRSIAALPEGYQLTLGEFFCHGCVATLVVRLERTRNGPRLVLAGDAKGTCI